MNQADAKEVGKHFFQVKNEVKDNDVADMLHQMYDHEFTECFKTAKQTFKLEFQTHVIMETGDSVKREKTKCLVYDDHQDIEEYQVFLIQTVENRRKTLYRRKLHYGCLGNISKEHKEKSCANRRR